MIFRLISPFLWSIMRLKRNGTENQKNQVGCAKKIVSRVDAVSVIFVWTGSQQALPTGRQRENSLCTTRVDVRDRLSGRTSALMSRSISKWAVSIANNAWGRWKVKLFSMTRVRRRVLRGRKSYAPTRDWVARNRGAKSISVTRVGRRDTTNIGNLRGKGAN